MVACNPHTCEACRIDLCDPCRWAPGYRGCVVLAGLGQDAACHAAADVEESLAHLVTCPGHKHQSLHVTISSERRLFSPISVLRRQGANRTSAAVPTTPPESNQQPDPSQPPPRDSDVNHGADSHQHWVGACESANDLPSSLPQSDFAEEVQINGDRLDQFRDYSEPVLLQQSGECFAID